MDAGWNGCVKMDIAKRDLCVILMVIAVVVILIAKDVLLCEENINYGFFNDRIYGSLEYYNRLTTDLLTYAPVAAGTNFTNKIDQNIGDLVNKGVEFGRANIYAKMSNKLFRNFSNKLIAKGYFNKLNRDLRKINSPFVARTYVSMILFTTLIGFMVGIFLFIGLLFFNVSALFPFLTPVEGSLLIRFLKIFWILFATPLLSGTLIYFYPSSEGKNLGAKITQELPFVAIHMSAVAASGIEPIKIFNILLTSGEYRYTNIEIRKLVNLINFHGKDLVSALKQTASTSSSLKLKELLDGLATSITSGGDLHHFLDKHAETLLFDYRLERERYTKTSETFMDIYISIVIAAPMILLILFVIMGSTGALGNFMGLSVGVLSLLIILAITILNLGFLMFLKLKQPVL